jgi:hypothetical protein
MASDKIDDEKIVKVVNKVMKLLNKENLSIPELILFYGNLGYHIGASIAGCSGVGPDLETLKKEYYRNPTVDVALMQQGLIVNSWAEDFLKRPALSSLGKVKKE